MAAIDLLRAGGGKEITNAAAAQMAIPATSQMGQCG
jgi:hypothetical protein